MSGYKAFDRLITSDLAGVIGQASRMASSFIRPNGIGQIFCFRLDILLSHACCWVDNQTAWRNK